MDFEIGDQVIHSRYGLGEVVSLDEKIIDGQNTPCYVVKVGTLQLWVPSTENDQPTLRFPTPQGEFESLIDLLQGNGEPLPEDRNERRLLLYRRVSSGKLESICSVVRDLWTFRRNSKMNDNDKSILQRCQNLIIAEWKLVFSVSDNQAEESFNRIMTTVE